MYDDVTIAMYMMDLNKLLSLKKMDNIRHILELQVQSQLIFHNILQFLEMRFTFKKMNIFTIFNLTLKRF